MPYCGSYGCPCCTCEKCGGYNNCICDLKAKAQAFIGRNAESEDPEIREAIDLLNELGA